MTPRVFEVEDAVLPVRSISGPEHNPHEVLLARCAKCQERQTEQRVVLAGLGWGVAVVPQFEEHPGFELCPQCRDGEYTWIDLY